MNRYLLDTHILLWGLYYPDRLTPLTRAALASPHALVMVSVVSLWEIAIKTSLGKLPGGAKTLEQCGRFPRQMGIEVAHLQTMTQLPLHHKDPFDRLLLAQAKTEGLMLVTGDRHMKPYGIPLLLNE